MGLTMAAQKNRVHCDNQTVVDIWESGTSKSPEIMALVRMLFFCAAHNNFNMCVQHIPGVNNVIADALSRFQQDRFRKLAPNANLHPDNIPAWPQQAFTAASCSADIMVLLSHPDAPQSGLNAYFSFCSRFNITPTPASSLTLQYFCVDKSQSVSYKTIKVYLAAIHLLHIETGFPDPTTDESLHLVCRGIRRQQSCVERARLPITINLVRTLKSQLRSSQKSLLDQRLLWAAFTLSFYGFLRASECLSLTWSDMLIHDDHLTITLRQSKTDPFRRGQSIQVYASLTTTCPV